MPAIEKRMRANVERPLKALEILRVLEDVTKGNAPGDNRPGLEDQDDKDDGRLSLAEIKELKRILRERKERVQRWHYTLVYKIRDSWVKTWHNSTGWALGVEPERAQVIVCDELDKPREFTATLPDRELTLDEQARAINIVHNSLREFGYINSPVNHAVWIDVPVGNGETTEKKKFPDTAIGRRLLAVYEELLAIEKLVKPKDKQLNDYSRSCRSCGSLCEVDTWKLGPP